MIKLLKFTSRHRWTFLMIAFIISFYAFIYAFQRFEKERLAEEPHTAHTETVDAQTSLVEKEKAFRENIQARPRLMYAVSLFFTFVLFVGLSLNLYIFARQMQGLPVMNATGPPLPRVAWGPGELFQMFVLLIFVEAFLISAELAAATFMGKETLNKDFMLMMNSLVRDVLVAGFVIFVVVKKYGDKISSIGLSFKDFFKNLKIGLIAYLAIIPAFAALLIITGLITKYFSYVPPPQPVVQIYLNESKHPELIFFTFFVALVGPVIEEIFFRGFTYQAFRSRYGVTKAMIFSSLVFSALHLNLIAFLPIFLLGFLLSYLYEKTGTLAAPMTVHMLHNFLMVCFTFFYKAYSGS